MSHADFAYQPVEEAACPPPVASVFSDRPGIRDEIADDIAAAGLILRESGAVAALLEGEARPLGEIVLLDCPMVTGTALAALCRADLRAARSGAQLIVSTTVDALDDVFACCDSSAPEILVDPSRAERLMALGRALARTPGPGVRELSQDDRLSLLRLTEQVGQLAQRLEHLDTGHTSAKAGSAFRFASPGQGYNGADRESGRAGRTARPPLPDPKLVRQIIRQRQLRSRFFDGDLFADPAWDILLDLTAARAEHARVSVTSLCIASGVPPTTALRWISQMTRLGLLERVEDETDRRRAFIALSDRSTDAMARYFAELGRCGVQAL